MTTMMSAEEANYRPGDPETNCASCKFQTPDGCMVVEGGGEPGMVSDQYAPRSDAGMPEEARLMMENELLGGPMMGG